MSNKPYKVGVLCPTYNQTKYIEQTLDAFCMQQTTFPYVCCILDDASTDGEPELLVRYLAEHFMTDDPGVAYIRETDFGQYRFARHKENRNCYFILLLLRENHYQHGRGIEAYTYMSAWLGQADYMAFCEGDDYWIDPQKLAKQARFLDEHPDYAFCFSNVRELNITTGEISTQNTSTQVPQTTTIADLAKGNYISTPTTLYRYDPNYLPRLLSMQHLPMFDYPLWLMVAEKGKLYKFAEPMAVYRVGSGSWSSTSMAYRLLKVLDMLHALPTIIESPVARQALAEQVEVQKQALIDLFDQTETDRQNVRREYEHVVALYRDQCERLAAQERVLHSRAYRFASFLTRLFAK